MTDPWHILGAGSIGCLWAAKLARAGYPVTLILRSRQRQQQFLAAGAVTLEEAGQADRYPLRATTATECDQIRNLLVCTKAQDTLAALESIRARLADGAQVLLLQNGMGAQQRAAAQLPRQRIWAGSTTDGAWQHAPFEVVLAGRGQTLLGPLNQPRLNGHLPAHLAGLDLALQADPSIELSLWRKLAINCAINPLTALYGCRNGELAEDPDKQRHMAAICTEVDAVAQALHLKLFPDGTLQRALEVARLTGANYSSMLQDIRGQRQTELAYITGYLCQQADRLGLALPVNRQLLEQVQAMERRNLRRAPASQ